METSEWKGTELRERMRAKGVPVVRLASEAQVHSNDMYRFLAGDHVGPVRRARIEAAAHTLGLNDDDDTDEK